MKTESRHTPRPWIRCDDDLGEIKIVGDGVVIARMAFGAFYDSEADANANLVAAAPDLFEAARKCLIALDYFCAVSCLNTEFMRDQRENMRQAIAKAEGV